MKTVKAEVWNIYITEGVMGMVHNQYHSITEIYIPEYEICFNVVDDSLHVFEYDNRRYKPSKGPKANKLSTIKISKDFVDSLNVYLKTKDRIKDEAIEILKNVASDESSG